MEYTTLRLYEDTKEEMREFQQRPNETDDLILRNVLEKARKYEESSN